jgi:DNA-directed RNA polymerase beta' subunit
LKLNEIAVPREIASTLSYPETINNINIKKIQELVMKGDANTITRGNNRFHVKYALKNNNMKILQLQIGDIVERKLQDGDRLIINRQPSLHKGSMLAKKIVVRDGKSIRLSLATVSTFNADFDGRIYCRQQRN